MESIPEVWGVSYYTYYLVEDKESGWSMGTLIHYYMFLWRTFIKKVKDAKIHYQGYVSRNTGISVVVHGKDYWYLVQSSEWSIHSETFFLITSHKVWSDWGFWKNMIVYLFCTPKFSIEIIPSVSYAISSRKIPSLVSNNIKFKCILCVK